MKELVYSCERGRDKNILVYEKPTYKDKIKSDITQFISLRIIQVQQMNLELKEQEESLKKVFSILKVDYDKLKEKYKYLDIFKRFVEEKKIKVSLMIQKLQERFNGALRLEWTDPYEFISLIYYKYQKFVLNATKVDRFQYIKA